MKRKHCEEDKKETLKMTRLEITSEADDSLVVATGTNVSISLTRHFNYQLSDKKAKSNLLKGAAREMFEVEEKQKCIMFTFNVGAYLEAVIKTVTEWSKKSTKFLDINRRASAWI